MEGKEIEMQPLKTLELTEELNISHRTLNCKEREIIRLQREILYLRGRLSRCGSLLVHSEANLEKEVKKAAIAEAALHRRSLHQALSTEHTDSLKLLSKTNTLTTPNQQHQQQHGELSPSLREQQQLQQKIAALELALKHAFSTPTDQQTFHSSDVAQLQQRLSTCEAKLRFKTTDYDVIKGECQLARKQLDVADVSLQQMTDAYIEAGQRAENLQKELKVKLEVQNKLGEELLMEQQQHMRTQHELQMMIAAAAASPPPSPSAVSSPGRKSGALVEAREGNEQKDEDSSLASEVMDLQHQLADRDAHIARLLAVIEELRQGLLEGNLETKHGKAEGGLRLMTAMLEQERVSRQQLLDAYTDSKERIKALTVELDVARKEVSRMKSVMMGGRAEGEERKGR